MSNTSMSRFAWRKRESGYPLSARYGSLVIGISLVLAMAGCGGASTIPLTYSCTSTCVAYASWSNTLTDFGGKTLQGAKSSILNTAVSCNAACQAEGGNIGSFIQLADSPPIAAHLVFIGFRADVVASQHYDWGEHGTTGCAGYCIHPLALVTPGDQGHFANYAINHYSGGYELRIGAPATFTDIPVPASFTAGFWAFGQQLVGTTGAQSSGVGYICRNHFTDVLNSAPLGVPPAGGTDPDFPDSVTSNGTVFQHAPPWARWIDTPLGPPAYPGGDLGTNA